MGGLAKIARAFGGITINGKKYVWDYVADKAVPEEEMPFGSERHAASERRRYGVDDDQSTDILQPIAERK